MDSQGGLLELGRQGIKSSNLNSYIAFYIKKICACQAVYHVQNIDTWKQS